MSKTVSSETLQLTERTLEPLGGSICAVTLNLLALGDNEEALTYLLGVQDALTGMHNSFAKNIRVLRSAIKAEVRAA